MNRLYPSMLRIEQEDKRIATQQKMPPVLLPEEKK
jgi:hypothetical protein